MVTLKPGFSVGAHRRPLHLRQARDLGQIDNVDRTLLGDRPAGGAPRQRRRVRAPVAVRETQPGRAFHHVAIDLIDRRAIGAEQAQASFQDGVEDRRRVRPRPADDPQHIGRRRLFAPRGVKFGARLGEFAAQRLDFRRRRHAVAKVVQGLPDFPHRACHYA